MSASTRLYAAREDQGDSPVECANCNWTGTIDSCDDIADIGLRICPGEVTPAGECPDCGALCYLADEPKPRSNRREVRNPVLALPATKALLALPPESRAVIAALLADLAVDARARAQASWLKNKGPMAAYWKAVGAYASHFRRVALP